MAHGAREKYVSQVGKKPHDLTANLTEMVCKLRFKCRNWRFSNHDSLDTYMSFSCLDLETNQRASKEIDDFIVVAAVAACYYPIIIWNTNRIIEVK